MRDPKLNMDGKISMAASAYGREELDHEASRSAHSRVNFGPGLNGTGPVLNNQRPGTSHGGELMGINGRQLSNVAAIRPKSSVGLNGTYDELYRTQVANGNVPEAEPPEAPQLRSGRPPPLARAKSDYGPRRAAEGGPHEGDDESWKMRHGWEDEYSSTEYLSLLNSVCQVL